MSSSNDTAATAMKKIRTAAEAGQRAAELSAKQQQLQQQQLQQQDTLLSHAGVAEPRFGTGAGNYGHSNIGLAPSLEFATTYTRPPSGDYDPSDAIYTRLDNPTRVLLERTVGRLECSGGDNTTNTNTNTTTTNTNTNTNTDSINYQDITCAFASGMMAASAIVLAHQTPLTVFLPKDLYHGVSTVMVDVFQARFGVTVKRLDLHTADEAVQELTKALLSLSDDNDSDNDENVIVWMESPSNPKIHVIDIQEICQTVQDIRAKDSSQGKNNKKKITTVVDSTMAPPVIQQPLKLGADLVMHSGTKYFGGHSDVLLGIVTASPYTDRGRELAPIMKQTQDMVGGVASPMDSWLTLRGMRTLHVRVERQCDTALVLAKHFYQETHQHQHDDNDCIVTAVHYPGLESHPRHKVAQRQMKHENYGGVLSVELKSEPLAMAFAGALQTIYRATSLGGTETLIEHRASIEPPERRVSPPGLLRITVGLEDATDLIKDIDNALAITRQVGKEMEVADAGGATSPAS